MLVLHLVKKIAVGLEMGRCRYPESDRLMFPVSPSTLCERDRCLEAETLADLGRAPALHQLRLSLSGWLFRGRVGVRYRDRRLPSGEPITRPVIEAEVLRCGVVLGLSQQRLYLCRVVLSWEVWSYVVRLNVRNGRRRRRYSIRMLIEVQRPREYRFASVCEFCSWQGHSSQSRRQDRWLSLK